ncbi:hypothetical protein Y88_3593 [Novosphingobium nitrogenifigens DSM 19370]|uniref:Uncharacterized protein n=1 Tax=Novosphingobium nitrogenifigens DSM 19370 TaxID=983920 RepID=F1ZDH5_9SPHN|nr:hypothetical protein Y88_3593 [Novosphingobium nitrogenifigens DSM 19370]
MHGSDAGAAVVLSGMGGSTVLGKKGRLALFLGVAVCALGFAGASSAQDADGAGSPFELAFWQSVSASRDPVLYQAYLREFPGGTFAAIAKEAIAKGAVVTAPPPAPKWTSLALPSPPVMAVPSMALVPRRARMQAAVYVTSGPTRIPTTATTSPAMEDLTTGVVPTASPLGMMLGLPMVR